MVLYFLNSVFPVQVLHLVEQLCLALNVEFRMYLLQILPSCIQVLGDAERCNDYCYVPDIFTHLKFLAVCPCFPLSFTFIMAVIGYNVCCIDCAL